MFKKNISKFKTAFIVLGTTFIIIGIFLIIVFIFEINYLDLSENKNLIDNIVKNDITNNQVSIDKSVVYDYIGILSIPKIKLSQKIYPIDSDKNDVSKNVQIIKGSTFPDTLNSNLILAAHSGNSKIAYFRNLDQLEINDYIFLYYKNENYKYKIVDIYKQEKIGKINIIRNKNETTLTLITCDEKDKKYQVVYISKLINV